MTHENQVGLLGEPRDGPQHDNRLPDARDATEYSDVEDSLHSVFMVDRTDGFYPPENRDA